MHFCVLSCIPDVSVEGDVLHIRLLLCHLVFSLQYSCLENSHGQKSLAGYSPWDCKESDMTEMTKRVLIVKPKTQGNALDNRAENKNMENG